MDMDLEEISLYEERQLERQRRLDRILTNEKVKKKKSRHTRSQVVQGRRYDQPRDLLRRVGNFAEVEFNDVILPYDLPGSVKATMKDVHCFYLGSGVQALYFLLECLPQKAIDVLRQEGILRDDFLYPGQDETLGEFRIEYDEISKKYFSYGKCYVDGSITDALRNRQEVVIPKSLAEEVYLACEGDEIALSRLKLFGFYTKHLDFIVEGASSEDFLFETDDASEAHLRFLRKRANHWQGHKLKYEMHPKRKKGGVHSVVVVEKEPKDVRNVLSKYGVNGSNSRGVQPEERYIANYSGLARACVYVSHRIAKSDHFKFVNPILEEPVKIILRYLQSRADRRLQVDLDEVFNLDNPVLSYRLSKWEEASGRKILSFQRMMRGIFGQYGAGLGRDKYVTVTYVDDTKEIHVSSGYNARRDAYVTDEKELVRGVRRVLHGEIDVSDFHILDPRSAVILGYAEEMRGVLNGNGCDVSVEKIAGARVPELRHRLDKAGLLHEKYFFIHH